MTRPVRISLKTHITDCTAPVASPAEEEQINYLCEGVLTETETQYEISYQENTESEMGETKTTLVFPKGQNDLCMMARDGVVNCTLSFSEGAPRQNCLYRMPFGQFSFVVNTKKLSYSIHQNGGRMHVEYYIEIQGSCAQYNRMSILITPQREG